MRTQDMLARYYQVTQEIEQLEKERQGLRELLIDKLEHREDSTLRAGEYCAKLTAYYRETMASLKVCESKIGREALEKLQLVNEYEVKQIKVERVA